MTAQSPPIAIVGASPFAWLLAGLLASDHSRAIVLVGDPPDPHRLWTLPALSAAPVTRPATWALLATGAQDTARRLSRLAPGIANTTDVYMTARTPSGKAALGHMRHTMSGFSHEVSPVGGARPPGTIQIRDALRFDPAPLFAAASTWLETGTITRLPPATDHKEIGASQIVLADDDAILAHLPPDRVSAFARIEPHTGIETAPLAPLAQPLTFDLDTGAVIAQSETGALRASAPDGDGQGLARIAALLPHGTEASIVARTQSRRLVPHDGAPVIGRTRHGGPFLIAGLGSLDLTLAPVIARLLAGQALPPEADWAALHGAGLRQPRKAAAEFIPAIFAGTPA